jgi:hypothetical protein
MRYRTTAGRPHKLTSLSCIVLAIFLLGAATHACASVALLMEEPYGKFGAVNPTVHTLQQLLSCRSKLSQNLLKWTRVVVRFVGLSILGAGPIETF